MEHFDEIVIPTNKEKRMNFKFTLTYPENSHYEKNLFCSRKQAITISGDLRKAIQKYENLLDSEDRSKYIKSLGKKWAIVEEEISDLFSLIKKSSRIDLWTWETTVKDLQD